MVLNGKGFFPFHPHSFDGAVVEVEVGNLHLVGIVFQRIGMNSEDGRKRILWLALLVFGNLFSGAGIAFFGDTILAYVSLVFFLPLLIDSGASFKGAQQIHAAVKQVTDQPVRVVINSGGQDHRWMGNGYFLQHGARIIASTAAVADQHARLQEQLSMLGSLVGTEGMAGTEAVYADETYEDDMRFALGGTTFVLQKVGPAHTPGDSLVWLPSQRIVFSGDVVYVGRMLGIMPHSNSAHWIDAFDVMAALDPVQVVPGHGPPTGLGTARTDTRDYLVFLRDAVRAFMENSGDITQVGTLDQSRFAHLVDYETLKGRNAQQVYQEMEWE